jgi:hypothetical protein
MITKQDLVGSWLLQNWEAKNLETGEIKRPYGESARGLLMYNTDGWMSASLCSGERKLFPDYDSLINVAPELKVAAFDDYFNYAGTYHLDGDEVIHDVEFSSSPNFPGSKQIRTMKLEGDILILGVENSGSAQLLKWKRSKAIK